MNNNCELCGGKYDFRMTEIGRFDEIAVISLSGSVFQIDNNNRFYYCPKCGRKLTKENFKGTDFGNMNQDKPNMREKIKEYIGELDTEIDRLESDLEKQMTYNAEACKVTATESRLNAIIEVKNDLLGRLEEVI